MKREHNSICWTISFLLNGHFRGSWAPLAVVEKSPFLCETVLEEVCVFRIYSWSQQSFSVERLSHETNLKGLFVTIQVAEVKTLCGFLIFWIIFVYFLLYISKEIIDSEAPDQTNLLSTLATKLPTNGEKQKTKGPPNSSLQYAAFHWVIQCQAQDSSWGGTVKPASSVPPLYAATTLPHLMHPNTLFTASNPLPCLLCFAPNIVDIFLFTIKCFKKILWEDRP